MCGGTAVWMMDRTGGRERWRGRERETGWSAFYNHLEVRQSGNQSVWDGWRFMIWSSLMDGWYLQYMIIFSPLLFSSDFWYPQLQHSAWHSKICVPMMRTAKATGGHEKWYIDRECLFNCWLNSQQQENAMKAVSVDLSYELYSLLLWYLRPPDQQFPGRPS